MSGSQRVPGSIRDRDLPWASSRSTNPIKTVPPLGPNHLLQVSPSNTISLGGEDFNIGIWGQGWGTDIPVRASAKTRACETRHGCVTATPVHAQLFPVGLGTAHVLKLRKELGHLQPQMGCMIIESCAVSSKAAWSREGRQISISRVPRAELTIRGPSWVGTRHYCHP